VTVYCDKYQSATGYSKIPHCRIFVQFYLCFSLIYRYFNLLEDHIALQQTGMQFLRKEVVVCCRVGQGSTGMLVYLYVIVPAHAVPLWAVFFCWNVWDFFTPKRNERA